MSSKKKNVDWIVFDKEDTSCAVWVSAPDYKEAIQQFMDVLGFCKEDFAATGKTVIVVPAKDLKVFDLGCTVKYTLTITPAKDPKNAI